MDQFNLVILGGTGDLARRKLLPALYSLYCQSLFDDQCKIILVSADKVTADELSEYIFSALAGRQRVDTKDRARVREFAAIFYYGSIDLSSTKTEQWSSAFQHISGYGVRPTVFYLATPPELYENVIYQLQQSDHLGGDSRIAIEKPFGCDGRSASKIDALLREMTNNNQVHLIDHYLGKETVQNLLALRFANSLFEPIWRKQWIDHVQITVAEQVGVDDRWAYYQKTGALRDMVQNHVLQLLCLVAMEPPARLSQEEIRSEKIKVLKALRRITPENVAVCTVRGKYTNHMGSRDGQAIAGGEEVKTAQFDSGDTETYVAIKAQIDNWRWSGTPFYLRTGKRLAAKVSEIVIQFRGLDHSIFPAPAGGILPNKLIIRLQPDEGITLNIMAKSPGWGDYQLCEIPLNLSFPDTFGTDFPDAYERLFAEILCGDPILLPKIDEILEAWRWVDEISDSWTHCSSELSLYQAGTWGPTHSDQLLARDQREWSNG